MNDVGESTAKKAPNVDIRERVCGEHRPIFLKGSEPSSEPFFWFQLFVLDESIFINFAGMKDL